LDFTGKHRVQHVMHTPQGSREILNNTQCKQHEGYNGGTKYLTTNKQCWKYKGVLLHDVGVVLDASFSGVQPPWTYKILWAI